MLGLLITPSAKTLFRLKEDKVNTIRANNCLILLYFHIEQQKKKFTDEHTDFIFK